MRFGIGKKSNKPRLAVWQSKVEFNSMKGRKKSCAMYKIARTFGISTKW
jgi:hypothetical protein